MKRLIIIVEGDTEKEFIDKVLAPYLLTKGVVNVGCFKIKHTRGGLTSYRHLKVDIVNCIYEKGIVVSTLIDYYALPKDFPKYDKAGVIVDKAERLSFLEKAIREDIEKEKAGHFPNLMPYIQLHEFEAFVFSSIKGITSLFTKEEIDFEGIKSVTNLFQNPEEINDTPETAPSKRLKSLIKGYNKVNDGIMIIEETGIETIIDKCPRFRNWVTTLIEKTTA